MKFCMLPRFTEALDRSSGAYVKKVFDKQSFPYRKVSYAIHRKGQGKVGELRGTIAGRIFHVDYAGAEGVDPGDPESEAKRQAGERYFSPGDIRRVTRRVGKHFPWVTKLAARRVSGANPHHQVFIPIPKPPGVTHKTVDRGWRLVRRKVATDPSTSTYSVHHPTLGPVGLATRKGDTLHLPPTTSAIILGKPWKVIRAVADTARKIHGVTTLITGGRRIPLRPRVGMNDRLTLRSKSRAVTRTVDRMSLVPSNDFMVHSNRYGDTGAHIHFTPGGQHNLPRVTVHSPSLHRASFGNLRRLYRTVSSAVLRRSPGDTEIYTNGNDRPGKIRKLRPWRVK